MATDDSASQGQDDARVTRGRPQFRPARPVVTLAAFYGAGGPVVGPQVATGSASSSWIVGSWLPSPGR